MKLFEDLRFFIGLFFAILGILLVFKGAFSPLEIAGLNPNLTVGCAYLIFGTAALVISIRAQRNQ